MTHRLARATAPLILLVALLTGCPPGDAGDVSAGAVTAGEVTAGTVTATGPVTATGAITAGGVSAGAVEAGDVSAGDVSAGDVLAGEVAAGDVNVTGAVTIEGTVAGSGGLDLPVGNVQIVTVGCSTQGTPCSIMDWTAELQAAACAGGTVSSIDFAAGSTPSGVHEYRMFTTVECP
jgi:hypothetical protein